MSDNGEDLRLDVPIISRRHLLIAAWTALGAFLVSGLAATVRFLRPNVLYEPSQRVRLGKAADVPVGVTANRENRLWLVRSSRGIFALSSRCTHLGCTPNWSGIELRFRCPCHGSNFTVDGDVIAGPAPKPLWRFALEIAPDGELVVDKSVRENRRGFRDREQFLVRV